MTLNPNDIVLFTGDSITHGNRGESMDCNHIMGHGYQFTIGGELGLRFPGTKYYNRGVSGSTLSDMAGRWQQDVLEVKPKLISILIGINDVMYAYRNGTPIEKTAEQYKADFDRLLEETTSALPDTQIILCEPFYMPITSEATDFSAVPHPTCHKAFKKGSYTEDDRAYYNGGIALIQSAVRSLAQKYGAAFVPLQDSLNRAAARCGAMEYIVWDGIHPTMVGHKVIADCWMECFNRI